MAADTWISVALDAGTASVDKQKHTVVAGGPSNGDVVMGWTSTKPMSLNVADSVLALFRQRLIGAGFK